MVRSLGLGVGALGLGVRVRCLGIRGAVSRRVAEIVTFSFSVSCMGLRSGGRDPLELLLGEPSSLFTGFSVEGDGWRVLWGEKALQVA